jgi:hypothetical protein
MSITNVFKKAFDAKKQVKQSASDEYRDLLHRNANTPADKWSEADEARLFELIDVLQITEGKATAEAKVVSEMIELANLASTKTAKDKAYVKANAVHQKALAERQAAWAEINAKVAATNADYEQAMTDFQAASQASGKLDQLKADHPHLAK